MKNQNLNILDEVNKGATMGMDAISYVSEKVVDNDFKEVLNTEYNKYKDISNRVNNLYDNFKKVHRSFYLAYYMEDGCKKASTVPFLASNVKNLASSFLKVKEYVEVF